MNATDPIQTALRTLVRRDGHAYATADQINEAAVHVDIAKAQAAQRQAQAFERIAVALEALAADQVLTGVTVQSAIGHSN